LIITIRVTKVGSTRYKLPLKLFVSEKALCYIEYWETEGDDRFETKTTKACPNAIMTSHVQEKLLRGGGQNRDIRLRGGDTCICVQ
jgi:hypothetical protein